MPHVPLVVFACVQLFCSRVLAETNNVPLLEEPEADKRLTYSQRLDSLHRDVPIRLNKPIRALDRFMAEDRDAIEETPPSKFRMGLYFETQDRDEFRGKIVPDFRATVRLPNAEKRLHLFLDTQPLDALPGYDVSEKEGGLRAGLRRTIDALNLNFDLGVRAALPPWAFVQMTWDKRYEVAGLCVIPKQRVYYRTDKGLGEVTSLDLMNWCAKEDCLFLGSTSALKWGTDSDIFEWEETVRVAFMKALIDEDKRGQAVGRKDAARAVILQYSIFGEKTRITRHKAEVVYRRPLYKDWLYMEIAPGIEWENQYDWDACSIVRAGIDALFWGEEE